MPNSHNLVTLLPCYDCFHNSPEINRNPAVEDGSFDNCVLAMEGNMDEIEDGSMPDLTEVNITAAPNTDGLNGNKEKDLPYKKYNLDQNVKITQKEKKANAKVI